MPFEEPLVSVVIPLHNAAATIEATLESVLAQTWRNLEVVVVDDGSSDDSAARVERMAQAEPRLRLLGQANAGVAAARNNGAQAARGEFLAFVDADDLWAPHKVALQMQALQEGGPRAGLAYTWSALIDEESRVFSLWHCPTDEGDVFRALCRANFVGNGSCTLMRREAFEQVGGYDSSLRARGAQGCEDLMIYLRIAERYEFRVVRQHLTGYRVTRANMSSDAMRMLRSCELTLGAFRQAYPQYAAEFEAHEREMAYWLLARALTTGPWRNAVALLSRHGFRHVFDFADRSGDLAWLMLKARAPSVLKAQAQRWLRCGGPYRPRYGELAL